MTVKRLEVSYLNHCFKTLNKNACTMTVFFPVSHWQGRVNTFSNLSTYISEAHNLLFSVKEANRILDPDYLD